MKSLQNYVEEAQTKLLDETGTFFAFSQAQFDEQKVEGVDYVSLGAGTICPRENVNKLQEGLAAINSAGIAQDLEENGKDGIIERELYNHEAFYTSDISDTVDALRNYPITADEVRDVYNRIAPTVEDC